MPVVTPAVMGCYHETHVERQWHISVVVIIATVVLVAIVLMQNDAAVAGVLSPDPLSFAA